MIQLVWLLEVSWLVSILSNLIDYFIRCSYIHTLHFIEAYYTLTFIDWTSVLSFRPCYDQIYYRIERNWDIQGSSSVRGNNFNVSVIYMSNPSWKLIILGFLRFFRSQYFGCSSRKWIKSSWNAYFIYWTCNECPFKGSTSFLYFKPFAFDRLLSFWPELYLIHVMLLI